MTNGPLKLTPDIFNLITEGHAAFQLMWAGAQLDLFTHLSRHPDGLGRQQIASLLGLQDQPARILLVGLASIGLIVKRGENYCNADLTDELLVQGKPNSMLAVLGWQNHIVYPGLVDFVESLKQGTNVGLRHFPGDEDTLYPRLAHDKKLETVFQDAMSGLSTQANKDLVDHVDLSGSSHLMDVGGGDGTNALAFARKYPHLKVTVFDSPSICEIANRNIIEAGLQDRVNTHPGELFTTPYPDGPDAIMYAHMFTIWSPENNRQILKKTYEALPSGGKALIFNMMGNDDDTGPVSTALGSPYFLAIATGEGMLYSWSDYEDWLSGVGFSDFKRIDNLPLDHGVFIGIK
jgi:methyltransferase